MEKPEDKAAEEIIRYLRKRIERNEKRKEDYRKRASVYGFRYGKQEDELDEETTLIKKLIECIWTKEMKIEYKDSVLDEAIKCLKAIENKCGFKKEFEEISDIACESVKRLRRLQK